MSEFVKYPRTPPLPWSPGGTEDDAYLVDTAHFEGREIVITEKMDGENTSLYREGCHARSVDGRQHPSRDWVRALHARIAPEIPDGWRLCGENVYARHSIAYDDLPSYFLLFSIWNADNECLSWDETLEWASLLELEVVPEWHRGPWNEDFVRSLEVDEETEEGYVVRLTGAFAFDDFPASAGKWVRPGHVQTGQHWMHAAITPNGLAGAAEPDNGDGG